MTNEDTKALQDKAHGFINNPFLPFLEDAKMTGELAAKKLKAELNAKETKTFHNKDIKPEIRVCPLCNGECIDLKNPTTAKGKPRNCKACKGNGSYVISPVIYSEPMIDWKTRQEARKDLVMYLGLKPAEKKELSGVLTLEQAVKELEEQDG